MDVVGIGLCTFDIMVKLPKLPTWENPVLLDEVLFDGGGPCSTALCAAARLGAKASLIATAGNDWFAEYKLKTMTDLGVDISHVLYRNVKENQIVCVNVDGKTGERIFNLSRDFYRYPVRSDELDRDFITSAEYLLLDGHYFEASIKAARWMLDAGKKVVLDGGKTSMKVLEEQKKTLVELSDILICGEGFAEALTGEKELQKAGNASLTYGPQIVVITMGENGSFTFTPEKVFHTPVFAVDVVDTTGAGDVFHGAYIFGLLKGWDLENIALFASAVSAIECTFLGGRSGIPDYKETIEFLKSRGISLG
jgi:sugar/nucleoside kinase (ribokinase family)